MTLEYFQDALRQRREILLHLDGKEYFLQPNYDYDPSQYVLYQARYISNGSQIWDVLYTGAVCDILNYQIQKQYSLLARNLNSLLWIVFCNFIRFFFKGRQAASAGQ